MSVRHWQTLQINVSLWRFRLRNCNYFELQLKNKIYSLNKCDVIILTET